MNVTADPTFDTSEVKRLLKQLKAYNSEGRLDDRAASLLEEARFVAQSYKFFGEPNDEQKLRALVEPPTALRDALANEQGALPWPKPSPLPPLTPPAPVMTPDLLPEPLRGWLIDAAARHSVHIEMIAVAAVVAAASLLGRVVGLHPKEYDLGWLETSNLWGAVVAPPSSRKTQAINEGMRFVRELQSELIEQHRDEQVGRGVKKEIAELEIGQLKRKAAGAKGSPGSIETELVEKMQALQSYDVPEPRLYVNDTSVEKLGDLLAKNPRGLLFYRDELAGLLADMDKHGNEGQRAFMLEAWNGKGSYTFDRIGRGTLHIPAVNLSVIGGIQPGKLKPLVNGAIQGNTGADGLLQRFQLVAYPDRAPNWHRVDREPDKEAEARAFNIYRSLMELQPDDVGAVTDRSDGIGTLHFAPDAQSAFNTWLDEHVPRSQSLLYEEAPAFQSYLAKLQTLVVRLALVFHMIDVVDGAMPGPVSLKALNMALAWARLAEQHARKIYATELNTDLRRALDITDLIKRGEIRDGVNVRDIYKGRSLGNAEAVNRSLTILAEHHWLRVEEQPNPGARPSSVVRLNPELALG